MRTNPVIEIRGERFALIPEQEYLELLDHAAVAYRLVLTKADAVKPAALAA